MWWIKRCCCWAPLVEQKNSRNTVKSRHKYFIPYVFYYLYTAINGGWSNWPDWGDCSTTCGKGTQSRERRCNNPNPQHRGRKCTGEKAESRACENKPCRKFFKPLLLLIMLIGYPTTTTTFISYLKVTHRVLQFFVQVDTGRSEFSNLIESDYHWVTNFNLFGHTKEMILIILGLL